MSDPKSELMQQVRQQAALQNARQLVDVRQPVHGIEKKWKSTKEGQKADTILDGTESQRTLLRALRAETGDIIELGRDDMLHGMKLGNDMLQYWGLTLDSVQACMDKYMKGWNIVSQQYLSHIQKGPAAGQSPF